MKPRSPTNEQDRFTGNLRHYHRVGAPPQRTWDDWVDGDLAKSRSSKNWLKIIGIVVGALALIGIIVGLVVEMS